MSGGAWILIGAVCGFVAVAAGAFGAHFLRERLSADMLAIFETGARYQMYHALAIVLVGVLARQHAMASLNTAGSLFLLGILIFSGSLYLLSWSGLRWLGAITPIGGMALLGGWIALALASRRL